MILRQVAFLMSLSVLSSQLSPVFASVSNAASALHFNRVQTLAADSNAVHTLQKLGYATPEAAVAAVEEGEALAAEKHLSGGVVMICGGVEGGLAFGGQVAVCSSLTHFYAMGALKVAVGLAASAGVYYMSVQDKNNAKRTWEFAGLDPSFANGVGGGFTAMRQVSNDENNNFLSGYLVGLRVAVGFQDSVINFFSGGGLLYVQELGKEFWVP